MTTLGDLARLTGRVAIVTGGGSGIGKAIALEVAALGGIVVVADIDFKAAQTVSKQIAQTRGHALPLKVDIALEEEVGAMVEQVVEEVGQPDILVNNAAMAARSPTVELATEKWRQVMEIGLDGTFYATRAVGHHMTARRMGAIVNVASIMGLCGGGHYPNLAYHAVKGAVVNMTRALALEWADLGVRVNAVAPTFARTPLTEKLLSDPEMERTILEATPLGRLVEPEEVAHATCFLASDAASMITGHTLPVDGGWLAK